VPLVEVTAELFSPYGRLFSSKDSAEAKVDITRWPAQGWRECHDGISGGTTSGTFSLEWRGDAHAASNSGVTDGDYLFAWTSANAALEAANSFVRRDQNTSIANIAYQESLSSSNRGGEFMNDQEESVAYTFTEINYHADGGQTFYSPDLPFVCCVALPPRDRAPDDILPTDFRAFFVPAGLGCHVNAYVYHCPPIATVFNRPTYMFTEQGKVHSKFYYDPLQEHNTLLRIPLHL